MSQNYRSVGRLNNFWSQPTYRHCIVAIVNVIIILETLQQLDIISTYTCQKTNKTHNINNTLNGISEGTPGKDLAVLCQRIYGE